jgi:hypothetical protein
MASRSSGGAALAPSVESTPGAERPPTGFNDLSPECFVAVFSRLGADEAARAMCVHPLWATCLRDDMLWRAHLVDAFAADDTQLPSGSGTASSYRWG